MTSTHFIGVDGVVFKAIAHDEQHALCLEKTARVTVGDHVVLREMRLEAGTRVHTGSWLIRRVTSSFEGEGLLPTHAVYSLGSSADSARARALLERQVGIAERQGLSAARFFSHQERRQHAKRELLRKNSERVARLRTEKLAGVSSEGR